MYIPKYFTLDELFSQKVVKEYGEQAWQFMDDRVLFTLDALREKFGAIFINDWAVGGNLDSAGFRAPDDPTGAEFSQHKQGRAADCHFKNYKAEDIRQKVLAEPDRFPYITAIETGVNWFHFDVRNCKRIMKFSG
jgi:hypothetical protein